MPTHQHEARVKLDTRRDTLWEDVAPMQNVCQQHFQPANQISLIDPTMLEA